MEATAGVAATSNTVHTLTACLPSINPRLSLFPRENLHWHSAYACNESIHSAFSSAYRIGPPKRNQAFGRSSQGDEDKQKTPRESPSGRWSDQKRLLALFKRIETSISRGKSKNPDENNAKSSRDDDNASFKSVLEALQQAESPKKVRASNKQASKTEKEPTSIETSKTSSTQLNAAEAADEGVDQEPLGMEKMKLTELKEVAKARGIKGYSKMKKSELVDLLMTQPES